VLQPLHLRLRLGRSTWSILYRSLSCIVEIPEEKIVEATRLLFDLANLKAEPTGALSVAALLAEPELFRGHSVCCIVSGGNVHQTLYGAFLEGRELATSSVSSDVCRLIG